MVLRWKLLTLLLLGYCSSAARGQITPIAPFTGTVFENFNVSNFLPSYQQYPIFGGQGLVQNIHPSGALKYEFSSTRGGDTVLPRSFPTFGGQIGISQWTFTQPVSQFGAYWENNSRFDHGVATFYDTNNQLLGSLPMNIPRLAQTWTWNGWSFGNTPVSRLVIEGNDTEFFSGFIWYEDATANFAASVPEPTTWMLLGLSGLGAAGYAWRHYRKKLAIQDAVME